MFKRRTLATITVIGIIAVLLIANPQPVRSNPKFVIASWSYPDEYGQGITAFAIYENSTGSWEVAGALAWDDEDNIVDWNASLFMRLRLQTRLNSTLVGVSTTDEGKNYLRHHILVVNSTHTVFEQQNFTYDSVSISGDIYRYFYDIVLDFEPQFGQIYTVTLRYEIWW